MSLYVIPFPTFDPVLISIGPFAIRWYALAYIVGILARLALCARRHPRGAAVGRAGAADRRRLSTTSSLWVTLGIILGGRLGYVLFYNPGYFAAHPLEILQLWKGGMSFHGGFLGCVLAVVPVRALPRHLRSCRSATSPARRRRSACSSAASPISSTASCGAGRPTCPGRWCFRAAGRCRAIRASSTRRCSKGSCCSSCSALLIRAGALKRPGLVTGAFALGYGVARSICEFFREPDAQLGFLWGGLTMGMLLSLPLMLVGHRLHGLGAATRAGTAELMAGERTSRSKPRFAGASRSAGPMPVAHYMALCLTHPRARLLHRRAIRSAPPATSSPRPRSARCSAS